MNRKYVAWKREDETILTENAVLQHLLSSAYIYLLFFPHLIYALEFI
jgi:hypothetical protein